MVFPEIEITQWGFFDSRVKFPKVIITDPRAVTEYELELYTDPQPGTGCGYLQKGEEKMKKNNET